MQIPNDRPTGKPAARDEHDGLLYCWMTMMGLDFYTIERDYSETFDTLERRCMSCRLGKPCAADLKRYPNNLVWEAYCPNAAVLNALVELTEVRTID
jgi:hypothetical protein